MIRVFELHVEGEDYTFLFDDLENFIQTLAELEEAGEANKVVIRTLQMNKADFLACKEVSV